MLYKSFTIKDKEYRARLSAKCCVDLERRLGTNPINVFTKLQDDQLPKLEDLLTVLHCSLVELNHGISMEDTYSLFDEYCDEGGDIASLMQLVIEIMKTSGFLPKAKDKEKAGKKTKN